jgi:hypothetical protein
MCLGAGEGATIDAGFAVGVGVAHKVMHVHVLGEQPHAWRTFIVHVIFFPRVLFAGAIIFIIFFLL